MSGMLKLPTFDDDGAVGPTDITEAMLESMFGPVVNAHVHLLPGQPRPSTPRRMSAAVCHAHEHMGWHPMHGPRERLIGLA